MTMLVASLRNIFVGALVSSTEGESDCATERTMNRVTNPLMRRATVLAATVIVAGIATGALATPVRADQWSKTYQVNGRADLHVTTGDGDVTITGSDQHQIDAHVTTNGWKIGPNDVQIIESQSGNSVSIEVKVPHWNFSLFGGGHRSLRVEVGVPRDLDLNVRTSDGNVTALGVSGKIQFDTGDGNLRIDGRFDALALKTGDGSIEAQVGSGSKLANSWNLHSGDGHITLRVPSDLNAMLDAHTGDGSITLDVPIQVSGSLSHSSVRGKLNAGGPTLAVSSGDGSIHIEKL